MKTKVLLVTSALGLLSACSTGSKVAEQKAEERKRIVIDNTYRGKELPSWTRDGKHSWEDDKNVYLKGEYTVKGDQRINGCYDLAKFELKENLITEISSSIKGEVNLASEGISEGTDSIITKSFIQQLEATIRGLKYNEQLFERYVNGEAERVDCFVMGSISRNDYNKLKMDVLQKMSTASPAIAEAIRNRQVDFFSKHEEMKNGASPNAEVAVKKRNE